MKEQNNILGNKQIFIFNVYVGNILDENVDVYVETIKNKFKKFNEYEDVIVFYIPVRIETTKSIIKVQ